MKKFIYLLLGVFLFLSGCGKEEPSHILLQQYDVDGKCFRDDSLIYNLNDDRFEDLSIALKYDIDTLETDDYSFEYSWNILLINHQYVTCGIYTSNEAENRSWQEGDTVPAINDSIGYMIASWGGGGFFTSSIDTLRKALGEFRDSIYYWGYFLEYNGKLHYGWLRMRCNRIEASAWNTIPEELITIGQVK